MLSLLLKSLSFQLTKDDRFEILVRLAAIIYPEYRFKWPQQEWWQDPNFDSFLQKFDGKHSRNADRRWMIFQLMRLASGVPGDTAECGSYTGAGSYIIVNVVQNGNSIDFQREHFIFDSFEGLSAPSESDGQYWSKSDLNTSEDILKYNLGSNGYTIYRGWIPNQFHNVENRTFSFVHIDVDLYQPTKDSLEFFYPKVSAGGIILFDDYGFTTCPGATKAIDDFFEDKQEAVIGLSGGGGFIIKGSVVSVAKEFPDELKADSKDTTQ